MKSALKSMREDSANAFNWRVFLENLRIDENQIMELTEGEKPRKGKPRPKIIGTAVKSFNFYRSVFQLGKRSLNVH